MVNGKLATLLNRLKGDKLVSFQKYVDSPFFNEKKDLSRLYDYLKNCLPLTREKYPDKEAFKQQVWAALYPSKPYDDVRFRRMVSDLTQLFYGFLSMQSFRSEEMDGEIALLETLNTVALEKHFNGILRKVEKKQEESTKRNADFFFRSFQLVTIRHKNLEKKGGKYIDLDIMERADFYLDCFFIIQKLKYYCDYLGYRNFLKIDGKEPPDFQVLEQIQGSPFLEEPAIHLFFLATKMLREPDEESFFINLRDGLYRNAAVLDFEEQRTLFTHLINYCIHLKINRGKTDFYQELFQIYSRALDLEILQEDRVLPVNHYKNLITLGLHLREFEWVESFIRNYSSLLPDEHQENAIKYNLAILHYHKEEYEKTIELLRDVELRDISLSLGSKLYLLRSYFELGEFVALDFLIDSFRIYLRRNRFLSRDVVQQYLNILRFTKKLAGLSADQPAKLRQLHHDISVCKNVAIKSWLLEKVDEMLR